MHEIRTLREANKAIFISGHLSANFIIFEVSVNALGEVKMKILTYFNNLDRPVFSLGDTLNGYLLVGCDRGGVKIYQLDSIRKTFNEAPSADKSISPYKEL